MAGGSIYIDPDRVSNVSSQIGMTADQLDSLRQSIVPRVNEVISMSYPSVQEMPGVAYPLTVSQDNIEAFNYRARILVDDLRTTSMKLNQIAAAGRTMNDILLRQATTFGATGSGSVQGMVPGNGMSFGFTWKFPDWKTLLNDGYTAFGLITSFISMLSKSGALKGYKPLSKFAGGLDNPYVKLLLTLVGAGIDFGTGNTRNAKTGASDIVGALIGLGAGAVDGGDVVLLALGAIQLSSSLAGNAQGWLANQYPRGSVLNESLGKTSAGLLDVAKNENVGQVLDDLGALTIDGYLESSQSQINAVGGQVPYVVTQSTVSSDVQHLVHDTSHVFSSIQQWKIDMGAMALEDTGLGVNNLIQSAPLPSSWKSASQSTITTGIQAVSNTADYITHNQLALNISNMFL